LLSGEWVARRRSLACRLRLVDFLFFLDMLLRAPQPQLRRIRLVHHVQRKCKREGRHLHTLTCSADTAYLQRLLLLLACPWRQYWQTYGRKPAVSTCEACLLNALLAQI